MTQHTPDSLNSKTFTIKLRLGLTYKEMMDHCARQIFHLHLNMSDGLITRTARLLGMTREGLSLAMKRLEIRNTYRKDNRARPPVVAEPTEDSYGDGGLTIEQAERADPTRTRVFTFGVGQEHRNCVVIIQSHSEAQCRAEMTQRFGRKWCGEYELEDGLQSIKHYGYRVLDRPIWTLIDELAEAQQTIRDMTKLADKVELERIQDLKDDIKR